jgi:hypothetical protein
VSGRAPLPEALQRALDADHRAVRPLRPAWIRALWVAAWAGLALAALPLLVGLRADVRSLGLALTWGGAVLEGLAGVGLVVLALRESVPGSGVTPARGAAALGAGIAVQVLVAVFCWVRCGVPLGSFPPAGAHCFSAEGALALPAFALTMVLVVRAYAVRPRWAGVLGGAGAGLPRRIGMGPRRGDRDGAPQECLRPGVTRCGQYLGGSLTGGSPRSWGRAHRPPRNRRAAGGKRRTGRSG